MDFRRPWITRRALWAIAALVVFAVASTYVIARRAQSGTFTDRTFGFQVQLPPDYAVSPPDAATAGSPDGQALVFEGPNGYVQVEIVPYPGASETMTPADVARIEPEFTPPNPEPIAIAPGIVGQTFIDPSGAFGTSSDVWFFHNSNLFEVTAPAQSPALGTILASWRFTN